MRVRLTQIDGASWHPNMALMRLSHYFKQRGHEVVFTHDVSRRARNRRVRGIDALKSGQTNHIDRDFFEEDYDLVLGSVIFSRSQRLVERFLEQWPGAIVGGTGLGGADDWGTIEQFLGIKKYTYLDYDIYPNFSASIGMLSRGCRMNCEHCHVPAKEGKPQAEGSVRDIWRGPGHPRHLMLLDNDIFGNVFPPGMKVPDDPRERKRAIDELEAAGNAMWQRDFDDIRNGSFKISLNQGVNLRLLTKPEHAQALASLKYYDNEFKTRRIYSAFDNLCDERPFRRGIEMLLGAGVKGEHIMVYMLIGFDPKETWERIFLRYQIMREYGVLPYPMPYQGMGDGPPANGLDFRELMDFQKWVIRRGYRFVSFDEFKVMPDARRFELSQQMKLADQAEVTDFTEFREYFHSGRHDRLTKGPAA